MKKLSLLALFFVGVFAITSCKKEENNGGNPNPSGNQLTVEKTQRSMFIDFTGTWCGPCGQWGIPAFQKTLTDGGDKVVGFAVHAAPPQTSDLVGYFTKPGNDTPYVSPVLGDLLATMNGINLTGWPTLWLNDQSMNITNQPPMTAAVNAKATATPEAGVGLQVTRTAKGFTVRTAAKFFAATSGEYYQTVLIVEDDINNRQNVGQAGQTNYVSPFTHKHVVRGAAINTTNTDRPATFGDAPVVTGAIAADAYYEKSYTFESKTFTTDPNMLPSYINRWVWNPDKSKVIVILWKKNANGKYDFVNIAEKGV